MNLRRISKKLKILQTTLRSFAESNKAYFFKGISYFIKAKIRSAVLRERKKRSPETGERVFAENEATQM